MTVDLTGRVAIVTGAGGGLGRSHALLLAERGAKVVVNDIGGMSDDGKPFASAAGAVVDEIREAGGTAIYNRASVTDFDAVRTMVDAAVAEWGRVDILVNNAGILRDKSFAKMNLDDFRDVVEVHLLGAAYCTKAVWDIMCRQNYGRIVLTTSSSGLFGNFGQSNYGAAKMGLVGLMQSLSLEGRKYDIRVNCLAPTAATRMMEGLLSAEALSQLDPSLVSPGLIALVAQDAPTRKILCAGGGSYEEVHIRLTRGIHLSGKENVPEGVASSWDDIADATGASIPDSAWEQGRLELGKAGIVSG